MIVENKDRAAVLISKLQTAVKGQVITAEDAGYDAARSIFYGGIDRRPAAIVRVADAHDVAQVVNLARENGIELAVRGGGHSFAGYGVTEGGVVIDLSAMKQLDIDVEQRTAWAQGGMTAGEYTKAVGAHGLATGFGDTGSVGIGGITLGGGAGFLVRKYGLTIDDLLAAEIVTADGQILQIDEHHHPDLFWAIRGGGGNFGVVTRFKFQLHDVPQIVGGMLFLPATPEVVLKFAELAEAAPEELSTIAAVMIAPPMPFIPAEHHGKLITMAFIVYAGDVEAGERAIAPFRAIATPIADMIRPMTYPEMYPPEQEGYHPVAVARTMYLDALGPHEVDTIFEYLKTANSPVAVAQFRVLGGAVARVSNDATAYAHRHRKIMANVAAFYQDPAEKAARDQWAANFTDALTRGVPGVYSNFLGDEGAAKVREAYPGSTWDRLAKIKAQYDPTNLFHMNQNIPPAK